MSLRGSVLPGGPAAAPLDPGAAVLGAWLHVPHAAIGGPLELEALKARLTVSPGGPARPGRRPADPRRLFLFTDRLPGYLGVPRAWGLRTFPELAVDDRTSAGRPLRARRLPSPDHPNVLDPEAQARFMADVEGNLRRHRTMLISAGTGTGKTVVLLRAAARLGVSTLILVHLERLLHQWREEIADKLGLAEAEIGTVQSDRCDWDRPIAVGMLHSVAARRYPAPFYRAWGLVCFDEVDRVATEQFLPAVGMFPSRYRAGMSATLHRPDGADRAFFAHLGPVRARSRAAAMPMTVRVVRYRAPAPVRGGVRSGPVPALMRDDARNALIVSLVVGLWSAGRQVLVVSEGVMHLQRLARLCREAGVPAADMGQFTGSEQRVTPTGDGPRRVSRRRDEAELERVKREARLILATYQMVTAGIDIPRLDAGLDATPASSATQLVGRIRRPRPGKPRPVWITLVDERSPVALRRFRSRLRDYAASDVEVVDDG